MDNLIEICKKAYSTERNMRMHYLTYYNKYYKILQYH